MTTAAKAQKQTADVTPEGWLLCSAPVTLVATETTPGSKGTERRFRGQVYTGSPMWSWFHEADVYVDLAGFEAYREDIPALENHWDPAGWTTLIRADESGVYVEGVLLSGTPEEEPTADRLYRRLAQGFPMQMSGAWESRNTERVMAGQQAQVNGQTVTGPAMIYRSSTLREVSFVATGKDGRTKAMAASRNQKENEMASAKGENGGAAATATSGVPVALLATLKDVVGADRAIELASTKPQAQGIGDFAEELAGEVKALRASLATAEGDRDAAVKERDELKASLADAEERAKKAGAAPVVVTASGDSGAPPEPKPEPGTPEAWKAEFRASADLRREFETEQRYVTYKEWEARQSA